MNFEPQLLRWLRRLALIISAAAAFLQLRPAHAESAAAGARVLEIGAAGAPDSRRVLDLGPDRRPQRAPVPGAASYR